MSDTLSPYERTYRRLAGQPVDRAPNQDIIMGFGARYIGTTYDRYAQDHRILVEANLRVAEDFHLDMLSTVSDPVREASAFGAQVEFPYDGVPRCVQPLLASAEQWERLPEWDPWASPRTLDRIRAVELYQQKAGGHYPVCGWVEGAAAAAAMLLGAGRFLEDTLVAPEATARLLERCAQAAERFALAQVQAGADFIGLGDAVCSLMSPRAYRTYALPHEQRIIRAIHAAGAKVKLHICGNTSRHLADMATTGADVIDIDWMVDWPTAVRTFSGRSSANGNFDPVAVLLQGTQETVAAAVRACLAAGDERSMVSAGCEVPVDTPHANLLAHYQTLVVSQVS
jgi:MtaA/CmuA family methyltransferase